MQLFYRILIHDKNGRLKSKTEWIVSRSFLLQWLQMIHRFCAVLGITIKDYAGVNQTPGPVYGFVRMDAGANDASHGIVCGTGDTAVTNVDYQLETQIAEGAGAGQLNHGSQAFTAAAVVGTNVDWVLTRAFTNNSGGAITIKEIGLYTWNVDFSYGFCMVRDVLSTPKEVPDTEIATIQYTVRTTV